MPKTRQQKEETLKSVKEKLGQTKAIVFANFDGLKVSEVSQLRKECRENGVDYLVVKKTLLKKVFAEVGLEIELKDFNGGLATVFAYSDEVTPAKILSKFAKNHEKLKINGGVLENKFVSAAVVASMAQLPSKDELIAKVVGSIAAPLSGLVNVLQGNLRNLVYVLQAVKENKS